MISGRWARDWLVSTETNDVVSGGGGRKSKLDANGLTSIAAHLLKATRCAPFNYIVLGACDIYLVGS